MAPLNASSVFLLWVVVVALLGASTAAPPSGRPSRGDRTVPPPEGLNNRSADREDKAGSTHLRRERAVADGAVADAVAPGAIGAGADGPEARKALDSGIVSSRRKSKSSHSRRSENRERTSLTTQIGKQQSGDGQVDYYYYYFDSFEEGVTGSADFDDLREGGRREEDEPEDDDGASVMELLTMASWHKSQKTA